ncbi:electron transfer flavoprotein subunit beta/FixA family protein [Okibacterium endophyticum]
MRIVVLVKRVVVPRAGFRMRPDGYGVLSDDLDYAIGESDVACVQEAVAIRDAHGGEVVVVTAGDETADAVLQYCLDIGADRAVRVVNPAFEIPEPLMVGCGIAPAVRRERPDLVLCGAESPDDRFAASGVALGYHLGWPSVTAVTSLELVDSYLHVVRGGANGGTERLRAPLPALATLARGQGIIETATVSVTGSGIERIPLESLGLSEETVDEFAGGMLRRVQAGAPPHDPAVRELSLTREET